MSTVASMGSSRSSAVLQIAPSAHRRHAARCRGQALLSTRAQRDAALMPVVEQVWKANLRVYGHAVCGILMHSSLAVTEEGLPLGLAAIKFWIRAKFKGTTALKRSINPARVPIEQKESICWLDNVRRSSAMFARPEPCLGAEPPRRAGAGAAQPGGRVADQPRLRRRGPQDAAGLPIHRPG